MERVDKIKLLNNLQSGLIKASDLKHKKLKINIGAAIDHSSGVRTTYSINGHEVDQTRFANEMELQTSRFGKQKISVNII